MGEYVNYMRGETDEGWEQYLLFTSSNPSTIRSISSNSSSSDIMRPKACRHQICQLAQFLGFTYFNWVWPKQPSSRADDDCFLRTNAGSSLSRKKKERRRPDNLAHLRKEAVDGNEPF
jgi:hypothetical protein